MNHAMSDGFNIELLLVTQDFDRPQKRGAMIRSRHYLFALKPFEINQFQVGAVCSQSLCDPGCQHRFSLRIQKRKLQRRTTAVDDQDGGRKRHNRTFAELSRGRQFWSNRFDSSSGEENHTKVTKVREGHEG